MPREERKPKLKEVTQLTVEGSEMELRFFSSSKPALLSLLPTAFS